MNLAAASHPAPGRAPSTPGPFQALDECHQDIADMLVELRSLMQAVGEHEVDESVRERARQAHLFFTTTALNHHLDEERHVFPALLRQADERLREAIDCLRQDHKWLEANWMELGPRLDSLARGYTWHDMDDVMRCLDLFTALYQDHIALEESLIYPQARRQLTGQELNTMSREMAARRGRSERRAGKRWDSTDDLDELTDDEQS